MGRLARLRSTAPTTRRAGTARTGALTSPLDGLRAVSGAQRPAPAWTWTSVPARPPGAGMFSWLTPIGSSRFRKHRSSILPWIPPRAQAALSPLGATFSRSRSGPPPASAFRRGCAGLRVGTPPGKLRLEGANWERS